MNLPAFQIDVKEEIAITGIEMVHLLNVNTYRVCREIKPDLNIDNQVLIKKKEDENFNAKQYYTLMAGELSALNREELLAHFSNIRICFKFSRSVKNYDFHF